MRRAAVHLLVAMFLLARAHAWEWESGAGFRRAKLPIPATGKTGFTLLPLSVTGLAFTNFLSEQRHLTNQILLNGSGVAAGDVDGDGWCDLYFCSLDGPNRLYRNLGNWKFEDITEQAGVACPNLDATGAAFADLDGDGDLDLIVNSVGGGTHIFYNDGKGHFTEAPFVLNPGKGGTSLALGDIDGDGYLDLYVANYRTSGLMDMPNARANFRRVQGKLVVERINGRPVTDPDLTNRFVIQPGGRLEELGEPDVLYRNRGGTNFTPISFTDGSFLDEDGKPLTEVPRDWGLSVAFRDLNDDGLPDLYVCNDFFSPDRIWINQGGGRFRAAPRLALRKTSLFSMGIDFADINRDGYDDFVVLDMLSRDHRLRLTQWEPQRDQSQAGQIEGRPQYSLNTLFLNRGDGTYAEIAQLSHVEASEWSWCPVFLDVDLDGWEDLLVSTGQERASRDLDVVEHLKTMRAARRMSEAEIFQARRMFPRLATPHFAFRNRGDLTFEEVGHQWGFDTPAISHGMALCDLDNDGDLDVVVNNLNGPAGIYRNDTRAPRLAVRLRGLPPNTRGIGAKIKVSGGPVPQQQEMMAGGRYLSSDDAIRVFAAGTETNQLTIEVLWRGGRRSLIWPAAPNYLYEIEEPKEESRRPKDESRGSKEEGPLFEDVSFRIGHIHSDELFDDFARQPLLPRKLSQLGPGVSWFDVDGAGWDDLVIGSGRGGTLAVFQNNHRGGFNRLSNPALNETVERDQTSVIGWQRSGQSVLLAGSANYEDGLSSGSPVRSFDLGRKTVEDNFPSGASSTGPLAMGDVDGDGALDLFVGGRSVPGRYPEEAASAVYRNVNGRFQIDSENSKALARVGLVSGAVFSDVNGDGWPDLILACDWGPIRVFLNHHGKLAEATEALGLAAYQGWWNGVTTADFDGDGRLDIAASNWGQNTPYQSYRSRPLEIYYGDFSNSGAVDMIEAYFAPELAKVVPERNFIVTGAALPFLRDRFATHREYASASVQELLGEKFPQTSRRTANWLESTVFLNRGDHFEARPLPVEAQMAPAFGIAAADLHGDGFEDLFLAQNFFDFPSERPRCDAGRGLLLKGDGHGGFKAMAGQESGIKIYGQQRGCAWGDFDADGRIDLAVSQNGAATRLYRNVRAKPGLRVRLKGPEGNPSGAGAVVRLGYAGKAGTRAMKFGPAQEVHAGSGYWSQDSAVQVLGGPVPATHIWVRWPAGRDFLIAIPPQTREIEVDFAGQIRSSQ